MLNAAETGLHAARALARRGVPTVLTVTDSQQPGARTRACPVETVPDPTTHPAAHVEALNALARRFDRPTVLLPTNDADIAHLTACRPRLDDRLVPALADPAALAQLQDKQRAGELAQQVGAHAPVTHTVCAAGDLEMLDAMPFPAILKPLRAQDWRTAAVRQRLGPVKGLKVTDAGAARRAYGRVADLAPQAVFQEWVPGGDNAHLVCGALMRPDGDLAAWTCLRKLRQYPPGLGLGCAARLDNDPDVPEAARAILAAAGFQGVAEVEFKRDPRDGRLRLIEVNPRLWDQHGLALRAGVDLAWLQLRQSIDDPPPRTIPASSRATWVRGAGLLGAAKEAVRHGEISELAKIIALLRPPLVCAYWDWRDLHPALADIRKHTRALARRVAPLMTARTRASGK